ncbi:2-hydroxyacid dehydrogenase [Propylenella binzhouense]|uniref:Glyoxylate/hydroxypyruvate reductase A n=1 Tax=Propylenella binzhouense TaxID=2555902 RepID=A0A964T7U7_9HYPH|nr:glyoxylate/hydroxypyruvate reductase A [Propylenella binzhouense]MYZ50070.1 glyoxylate/hydroxypyruvate reductase A [Propylenella binzhouense]
MSVLVASMYDPDGWTRHVRAALPEHRVMATNRFGEFEGAAEDLAAVEHVLAWKPRQELLDRLPALKAIFSLGAGVDHLMDLPRLPNVPVVRIVDPDLTARMTEYVVWQVLHHHRMGAAYQRQQATRQWRDLRQPAARHVTVGLMGLGVLGTSAAEALLKIGFRVAGWSRTPKELPGVRTFSGESERDAFLAETDILVALLPLTPETTHILNRSLFAKLRRPGPLGGPVVINAGRGGSQNESDILAALRDGTLRGASLDVFEREPLPSESPLWNAPNLVVTPHVAAVSDPAALAPAIAGQIRAFERGEPLQNVVDIRRGY